MCGVGADVHSGRCRGRGENEEKIFEVASTNIGITALRSVNLNETASFVRLCGALEVEEATTDGQYAHLLALAMIEVETQLLEIWTGW